MKILILFFMLFIITGITQQQVKAQDATVSFQIFYDELSPYGTWVNTPEYGYAWVPNAGPGFVPYQTDGYWVFTDEGWTWVSDYSWGWAPFHYGRWFTDNTYGPMWVPGYEWGPGWVTWRSTDDYYGWAPIGPGISIGIAYGDGYYESHNHYTFLKRGYMGRKNMNKYYERTSNDDRIHNSRVINNPYVDKRHNVTYNAGPNRNEVEKTRGKAITPVVIKENSKPGQKVSRNQLQVYRPQVQQNIPTGQKPAPAKVESLNNVKPIAQRPNLATPQRIRNSSPKLKIPQQQRSVQPAIRQQAQPQRNIKQQPAQQQRSVQPAKQQQAQPQRNIKQQTAQQQPVVKPAQLPAEAQHNNAPQSQQFQQPQQRANAQQNQGGSAHK
ncbi:MAG: DUF6600 domain-containing protein [FCB group bacterium]|jgi:hypothetical protein